MKKLIAIMKILFRDYSVFLSDSPEIQGKDSFTEVDSNVVYKSKLFIDEFGENIGITETKFE